MLMDNPLYLPFVRNQFYSIGLLRLFLKNLNEERQINTELCFDMTARKFSWVKLWEEELFPMLLYFDHNCLPDEDEFKIMPEGDLADAALRTRSENITQFQITTAYREENTASRKGGYIASIERQAINQGIPVFLGGIGRDKAGRILSKPVVRYPAGDSAEWRSGLFNAIQSKISKLEYSGNVDYLLVFADRLVFDLLNQDQEAVVLSAVQAAMAGVTVFPFQKLIVLDRDSQGYFEYGPSRLSVEAPF